MNATADRATDSIDLDNIDLEVPAPAPTASGNTATEKQIAFIQRLIRERIVLDEELESMRRIWREGEFTKTNASAWIDQLLAAPRRESTAPADAAVAPEGMHKFGGVIFKVQRAVHGSGNLYAKALLEDGDGGWSFEYVPGAIRNLTEDTLLSIEEAKEFGALYGTCVVCGRALTNEDSIEAGIGPVCAKKF